MALPKIKHRDPQHYFARLKISAFRAKSVFELARLSVSACLLAIGLLISPLSLTQAAETQTLRPFTVSTPSPITDNSTISTKHIALLKGVFARAGLELLLVHDTTGRAVNAFEGGRYEGGIFIDTVHRPRIGVSVDTSIEYVEIIFIGKRGRANEIMKSQDITIANTAFSKKVMLQHHPALLSTSRSIRATSSTQIFRILQADRADLAFLPKPLLLQNHSLHDDFEQIPMGETRLSMHLYIHQKDAGLKPKLESLLKQHYVPYLPSINNNR